ncbi:hypothetical protein AVEN_182602-1 [Araneus ventricosus]|uniref:Uncharacterized protein n=1 Tax=Araneus ventricosus TaxID=182803 RepID=A0A4Y2LTC5_ARAVE|nr:hypothetical protein AVEN_182602-1 [Araneus ventricosus]
MGRRWKEGPPHLSKGQNFPNSVGETRNHVLQRHMAHFQLNLRDLASEKLIAVIVSSWEDLCTSQPAAALQVHIILPRPKRL